MRLFIAREMLDSHLKLGAAMFNTTLPLKERAKAFFRAAKHYAVWYPAKWLPRLRENSSLHSDLAADQRCITRLSRKLARAVFHAMLIHGPKLEREQLVLGRLVDIGTELFVWSATLARAQRMIEDSALGDTEVERTLRLAKLQGRLSREIVSSCFDAMRQHPDRDCHSVARDLMK